MLDTSGPVEEGLIPGLTLACGPVIVAHRSVDVSPMWTAAGLSRLMSMRVNTSRADGSDATLTEILMDITARSPA
jgi:hypothetical protein